MKNDVHSHRRHININSLWYLFSGLGGNAYVLISLPLLTATLGRQEFGAYVVFTQVVMSLQMVMSSLFGSAILRLRVDFEGEARKGFLTTMFLIAGAVQVLIGASLAQFGVTVLPLLYPNLDIPLGVLPAYIGLWSLLMTMNTLAVTLIKSMEMPRRILVQNLVYGISLLFFLWLFLIDNKGGITQALQALVLAESIAMLAAFSFLFPYLSRHVRWNYVLHALHFTGPLALGSALFALVLNLDGLVLSRYIDLAAMAVYGFGATLGKATAVAVAAYISSYSSRLINLYAESGKAAVERMLTHVMEDNFTLLTIVTLGVVISSEIVVQLLAKGSGYSFAAWVLAGGAVGNLSRSVFQVFSNSLFIVKRTRTLLWFNVILLGVTAVVMVLGAELAGASGVAYALAIVYLLMSLLISAPSQSAFQWRFPWPSFLRSAASVVAVLIGTYVILHQGWTFRDNAFWFVKGAQTAVAFAFWIGPLLKLRSLKVTPRHPDPLA